MSHEHASPEPETVAEELTSGGRRPSPCSRLADCLESPPPYRKHVTKEKLWLVLDAHGDSVLWSDQELAVDAAVEALNAMADGEHLAEKCCNEIKADMKQALEHACELFGEIERDEVNHQDEAGKWLRAYGHYSANADVDARIPAPSKPESTTD